MSAQPSLVAAVPQRRGVGSWQETTDLEKVVFGVRAVEALGGSNGYAFTLNLGPDVELRAHSDPKWLFRRFVAYLKRASGRDMPLIMALGAADGRLHVHGALAATDPEELERIRKALKAAGGPWASARGKAYQLDVRLLGVSYPAEGWGDYLLRNIAEAERIVDGGRCWYMSNPARRLAKVLHAEVRSKINAQRSNRATRTRASMPICGLQAVAPVPDKSAASYRRLSRYDATGLIWLLRGRPVVALTAATARDREPDWNVIYRRYNKPALGPLGDSLDDFA